MPAPAPATCLFLLTSLAASTFAQDTTNFPHIGAVERHDAALDKLIEPGTPIEVLSSGYLWTEGPAWDTANNRLLFSDVHANRVYEWVEGKGASIYLEPSGFTGILPYSRGPGSNGLAMNAQGQLVSCEHGDRRISVLYEGGGKRTLTDNYQGKRFNSPNDLDIDSKGNIFFTDPSYGLPERNDDPSKELDFNGVFVYVAKTGKTKLLTKDHTWPNGIALSPDEKTVYVAQSDSNAPTVTAYPVRSNLSLGRGKVIFDMSVLPGGPGRGGNPDGLRVDQEGNLWVSGRGGIQVISADGKHLGTIHTGQNTANCTFGGPDGSVLYITADMYLVRIQTKTAGFGF
jgi:gluconolactonase